MSNGVFQYTKKLEEPEAFQMPLEPDNNWYFWSETGAEAYGPYETEAGADLGLAEYCSQL